MLDNASNNDTLVLSLEAQLMAQGVEFLGHERCIRYVYLSFYGLYTYLCIIGVSHTS
jgi:hypothetical protein